MLWTTTFPRGGRRRTPPNRVIIGRSTRSGIPLTVLEDGILRQTVHHVHETVPGLPTSLFLQFTPQLLHGRELDDLVGWSAVRPLRELTLSQGALARIETPAVVGGAEARMGSCGAVGSDIDRRKDRVGIVRVRSLQQRAQTVLSLILFLTLRDSGHFSSVSAADALWLTVVLRRETASTGCG